MGLLDKLLGRGRDDDAAVAFTPFDADAVRPKISDLIEALGALADAMETPDAPLSNPGWRGRLRDLREARGDLRLLSHRQTFTKDDLYDVLTTVRPLYRGAPTKEVAHLAELNDQVGVAIEEVHRAASG